MALLQPSIGTTLKINVNFEVANRTMDDCDFWCTFYIENNGCHNKPEEIRKGDMIRVDENNYVAVVDSKKLGVGAVKCKLRVNVPDADCPNGYRTEVVRLSTGVTICE